jgi:hypothetical protein
VASQLEALSGVFSASYGHAELTNGHSLYLHLEHGHRISFAAQPTVFKLSKSSPLQILSEIPPEWLMITGALPAFAILFEQVVGRAIDIWDKLKNAQKVSLEVQKLKLEIARMKEERRIWVPEDDFRYDEIHGRLARIKDAGFCDWSELPQVEGR